MEVTSCVTDTKMEATQLCDQQKQTKMKATQLCNQQWQTKMEQVPSQHHQGIWLEMVNCGVQRTGFNIHGKMVQEQTTLV